MPRRRIVPPEQESEIKPAAKKRTKKSPSPTVKKISRKKTTRLSEVTPHAEKQSLESKPSQTVRAPTISLPQKRMGSTECFVYGGIVCLVGIIGLGLLFGFVVLPPIVAKYEQSQYSYAAPTESGTQNDPASLQSPAVSSQPTDSIPQPEFGFYGTMLSREGDVLMVKELLPPLPLEKKSDPAIPPAKTFVVRVGPSTEYTHQRPRQKEDLANPLFSPEDGALDNIKTDMFVFVSTPDDPEQTETVQANQILYSEQSPFTE